MDFFTKAERLYLLDKLVRKEKTGNIAELALKLGLSRAQMSHYIQVLRKKGFPIAFSPQRKTYFYTTPDVLKVNRLVIFRQAPTDQSHLALAVFEDDFEDSENIETTR